MEAYKVAGMEGHTKMLAVVIADAAAPGEFQLERRKCGAGAAELRGVSEWLAAHEVREAVRSPRRSPGDQGGQRGSGSVVFLWRRPIPMARREDASGTGWTPNGWCGATSPGNLG